MQAICWLVAAQNDSTSVVTRDVARNKIRVGIQCDLFSFVPCRIAPPRLLHACFTPATRLNLIACDGVLAFPVILIYMTQEGHGDFTLVRLNFTDCLNLSSTPGVKLFLIVHGFS